MRTHSQNLLATALLATLPLAPALAACDSAGDQSGLRVEIADTISYGSFGTTAEIDCADGKSLNVGGSNNTLKVKGTCTSVNIGGADNKITIERVDRELSVVGLNNTVTYSDGSPKVDDAGSGNRINEAKIDGGG